MSDGANGKIPKMLLPFFLVSCSFVVEGLNSPVNAFRTCHINSILGETRVERVWDTFLSGKSQARGFQ